MISRLLGKLAVRWHLATIHRLASCNADSSAITCESRRGSQFSQPSRLNSSALLNARVFLSICIFSTFPGHPSFGQDLEFFGQDQHGQQASKDSSALFPSAEEDADVGIPTQAWLASFGRRKSLPQEINPFELDESPTYGLYGFFGYDSWRGYPDGAWTNNGLHAGVNAGMRLGAISELTGIGFQIGGSVGVYDFAGTDYRIAKQEAATTQGFVTYGFFHQSSSDSRLSAAVVQDWMINDTYSVMAEDSTLSQIRTQFGVAVNDRNELGVWGAWRVRSDSRQVTFTRRGVTFSGPVTWQPHNQLNAYWHHRWPKSAVDSWIWAGVPERNRLDGDGSLGDYIAGAFATCPVSDRISLYTMVSYMHQSGRPGRDAAKEEAWNFFTGLRFYLQPIARGNSIGGRRWLPQLPVANNGLFLVDASQTY